LPKTIAPEAKLDWLRNTPDTNSMNQPLKHLQALMSSEPLLENEKKPVFDEALDWLWNNENQPRECGRAYTVDTSLRCRDKPT